MERVMAGNGLPSAHRNQIVSTLPLIEVKKIGPLRHMTSAL